MQQRRCSSPDGQRKSTANMMNNMMTGMDTYTLFWVVMGALLGLVLLATFIWLFVGWLNRRRTLPTQALSQPKDAYEDYQQGYQAQQSLPETYEEGGQRYPYPLDEQPQAQHLEKMLLQH